MTCPDGSTKGGSLSPHDLRGGGTPGRTTAGSGIRVWILITASLIGLLSGVSLLWWSRSHHGARPNLLLITLDTTRADHLGCYGYARDTSPNLDALAWDGVRFDFAISTSGLTPMSHASILTGLNPYDHGIRVFHGPAGNFLSDAHPTLAGMLRSNGWRTAAFVSSFTASEQYGLDRGFDRFDTGLEDPDSPGAPPRPVASRVSRLDETLLDTQRRGDATTEKALGWLRQGPLPFFLWVHYFDPHDPKLIPPREFRDRFRVSEISGRKGRIALYDPEIFFMDFQLGRVLQMLRDLKLYDNTIVVAVADHGQGMGDHGWMRHRLLYQEDIRVPLILRLPRGERGKVVFELVRTIDIMPTILEILGLEPPEPIQGRSLIPMMRGEAEAPRFAYAEALNSMDTNCPKGLPALQKDLLFSIVEPRWKLIYHQEHPENSELYDLADDPAELHNVADRFPEQYTRLLTVLEGTGGRKIRMVDIPEPEDEEVIRRLRSLGYVD